MPKRQMKKNSNYLQVTFVGEFAIDHGGPRREFFRLFGLQCSETYFRGKRKYFDVNAAAVQVTLLLVEIFIETR